MLFQRLWNCACCGGEVYYDSTEQRIWCKCGDTKPGPRFDLSNFKRVLIVKVK